MAWIRINIPADPRSAHSKEATTTYVNLDQVETITVYNDKACVSFVGSDSAWWPQGVEFKAFREQVLPVVETLLVTAEVA